MLPEWMICKDDYVPPEDGGAFIIKTIAAAGRVISRIRIQKGHEKARHLPALVKLFLLLVLILILALSRSPLIIMGILAMILAYLCTWPGRDIWNIFKSGITAGVVSAFILLPAMILIPAGAPNDLFVVLKVFLCTVCVSIYNHTTQWNHITKALRQIHVPGIFIFTLDITLKYIVLLGNMISDLLTSLLLRSVGKNNKKYSSIGGVMGVTFIRGTEMNRQMYEAMQCRGFTDDYEELG